MPRARAGTDSQSAADSLSPTERRQLRGRQHRHTAELHGPVETRNLTRWAQRQVLITAGYPPRQLTKLGLLG